MAVNGVMEREGGASQAVEGINGEDHYNAVVRALKYILLLFWVLGLWKDAQIYVIFFLGW